MTWLEPQIAQYRAHHQLGTVARLAIELLLNIAARRHDVPLQRRLLGEQPKAYEIQSIFGAFLGTDPAGVFGCPTIMGATGTVVLASLSADFPSGVPSQPWANPIQHVPNPAAQAANIKFSAAKAQSSTIHGPAGAEITISAGA